MSQIIGFGIRHAGIHHEDWKYPFYAEGTIVQADVAKAVALDTELTVKLADADAEIVGQLETWEDRVAEGIKVCTVSMKGGHKFHYEGTLAVGDRVVGDAVAGHVKKAGANAGLRTLVTAVDATAGTCQVILL